MDDIDSHHSCGDDRGDIFLSAENIHDLKTHSLTEELRNKAYALEGRHALSSEHRFCCVAHAVRCTPSLGRRVVRSCISLKSVLGGLLQ